MIDYNGKGDNFYGFIKCLYNVTFNFHIKKWALDLKISNF